MGVDHGGLDAAVAQELLDGPDVVVGLQEVAGKAVAEGVGGHPLGEPGPADRLFECLLHVGFMQMIALALPGLRDAAQVGARKEPLPDRMAAINFGQSCLPQGASRQQGCTAVAWPGPRRR